MKRLLVLFLLLAAAPLIFSVDFGLLLDQQMEIENELFTYTPAIAPWFSWNLSGVSVYLSGILSFDYRNYDLGDIPGDKYWTVIPELSRCAAAWRINQGMFLEAGRVAYNDAVNFTAGGLFDGLRFEMDLAAGTISAGMFYTGLLYKETAKIVMTGDDAVNYAKRWDWKDAGDYFASRRLLAAFRWSMPLGNANSFSAEFLTQFDLNGADQALHSQYGEVLIELYPMSIMRITAGALGEMMQSKAGGSGADFGVAFGGLAQLSINLPTAINDILGVTVKIASGNVNDTLTAFMPITSVTQGEVFPGTLSGLAVIGADYRVRIISSLFAEAAARYFICTDRKDRHTYNGNMLGGELWASAAWQPFEDMRVNLGAGLFIPGMGNAYPDGTDPMFKVSTGLTLSF